MLAALWSSIPLKLPLIFAILAVWWAIHEEPKDPPSASDDDGGVPRPRGCDRPRRPFPRPPRRGPHGGIGGDRFPAPPRIRTVHARARSYGR